MKRLVCSIYDGLCLWLVAKMVINDFLRGKIPWYIPDPAWPERSGKEPKEEFEGRKGKLGEMPDKSEDGAANEGEEVTEGQDNDDEDEGEGENDEDEDEEDSEGDTWDGLDVETDSDASDVGDDEISDEEGEEEEEERLKDPRPSKRVRV